MKKQFDNSDYLKFNDSYKNYYFMILPDFWFYKRMKYNLDELNMQTDCLYILKFCKSYFEDNKIPEKEKILLNGSYFQVKKY